MSEIDSGTTKPMEPSEPMKVTRERLTEIGEVWVEFAKQQAEVYKEKLPGSIKQYLKPKQEPGAASERAEGGAA